MFIPKAIRCKKSLFLLIASLLLFVGCSAEDDYKMSTAISSVSTNTRTQSTNTQQNKEQVSEETIPEVEVDFTNLVVKNENIQAAISGVVDIEKLKSIEVTSEKGKTIIDIFYDPGMVWDEKDLVNQTAQKATAVMEVLFKNPKVDKIWFWTSTKMTDAKGNEAEENVVNVCLTKENAKDINWAKFKVMVYSDYNKLFDIADSCFIYPSIKEKL